MNHLKLPSMRTVVENIPLETAKLDKILAESQSKVSSYLDVRYADSQDIIFLLGGKGVKAGRFYPDGREIMTVSEAMKKLRTQKEGTISFYEISKLLMIVIMGTFIFEPTHGGLKTKLINFKQLLGLFDRKHFTGYLELKIDNALNYLTFFAGQAREGYFAIPVTPEQMEFPVKLVTALVETSDEKDEISVYESVGEQDLHEDSGRKPALAVPAPEARADEEKDQFTAEIQDLCLVAIYEELFRLMAQTSAKHLESTETDIMFTESFEQAKYKHPGLFKGVDRRDDGSLLSGGLVNFEKLLKAKNSLPLDQREGEFQRGMNDLTGLRLLAMKKKLPPNIFAQGLSDLSDKITSSKRNYQGNFTIIKYLYELSRLLEKIQSEENA
ncbi:hypothetical protein JW933_04530 [candidate division FCPU426 bacterium]|nr:hypothetical protein [candidate division FCPU426 bacterium]